MRRIVPVLAFLSLTPACRHDLTLCHDENDGPACRDSAPEQSSESSTDSEVVDTGESTEAGALVDASDDVDASLDGSGTGDTEVPTDSTLVDSSATDSALSDTFLPDTYVSDTYVADTYVADTYVADTYIADTRVADTNVADAYVADTYVADTYVADTYVADAYVADTYGCATGSFVCGGSSGNDLMRCSDGGLGVVASCPVGKCSASLGRCTVCTPSAVTCVGAERWQCDTWGASSSLLSTCATAALCSGGVCLTPACAAGERRCGASGVETCNSDRNGWTKVGDCALGCSAGACNSVSDIASAPDGEGVIALVSDGTVRCWGSATIAPICAEFGPPRYESPARIAGVSNAVQIAQGTQGAAAVLSDGRVMCWGKLPCPSVAPVVVPGIATAVEVAVGHAHACARTNSGAVACWGGNDLFQLGSPAGSSVSPPSFAYPSGLTSVVSLSLGGESSFAILASTGAMAWGENTDGHLGFGAPPVQEYPASAFAGATQLSAINAFACARTSSGVAMCSGNNTSGQLGDGTTVSRTSPVVVSGLSGVKQVAVGDHHACALLNDGTVRCWGKNAFGELGNGTFSDSLTPVVVSGVSTGKKLTVFAMGACVLLNDNQTVKCWGTEALGTGTSGTSSTPVSVVW